MNEKAIAKKDETKISAAKEKQEKAQAIVNFIATGSRADELSAALGGEITLDMFKTHLLQSCRKNPKILECSPASVYQASLDCALTGLLPGGPFGEAALVPYNVKIKDNGKEYWSTECQFQPMVGGLIKLAIDGGACSEIGVEVVCEGELFSYRPRAHDPLHHEVKLPRGQIVGAYAWAKLPNGAIVYEVIDRNYIDRCRAASKSKDYGPWASWFDQMTKKTAIRRLIRSKLVKRSHRLALALAREEEDGEELRTATVVNTERVLGPSGVKAALASGKQPEINDDEFASPSVEAEPEDDEAARADEALRK